MFKSRTKLNNFVKRQVARLLTIVMAFSTFASAGMAITNAYAAPDPIVEHGEAFVDELLEQAAHPYPYVWGGWLPTHGGFDCRGFIRYAMTQVYGFDIMDMYKAYVVDENGDPILSGGKKQYIDPAEYDPSVAWRPYVGKRICIEGVGTDGVARKTFYRVAAAGYCNNLSVDYNWIDGDSLDISHDGRLFSSLIAYACRFPGSIISHNEHYGIALGQFDSAEEAIAAYPELNGAHAGTVQDGGKILRWSVSAYNKGNNYGEDDPRYWFGKTLFLNASSKSAGIRADNYTTTGKNGIPDPTSGLAILICEPAPSDTEVHFFKKDSNTGELIGGAKYEVYSDAACNNFVCDFEILVDGDVQMDLEKGVYYIKEVEAPDGYAISEEVYVLELNGEETRDVVFYDNPTNATVLVRKVDANNPAVVLKDTVLYIQERAGADNVWNDLVQLEYSPTAQAFELPASYTDSNYRDITYTDRSLHYTQANLGEFRVVEKEAQSGYILDPDYSHKFNIEEGNLYLVGDKAIRNYASFALFIQKIDTNGEVIPGVEMTLRYNGEEYVGITDEFGTIMFTNIPEGETTTGYLFETGTPDGYYVFDNYKNGQPITFTKEGQVVNGNFVTMISVVNGIEDQPVPLPTQGTLVIHKIDASRVDAFDVPVQHAKYTVYTDPSCTDEFIATKIDGTKLEKMETNAEGKIIIENLPVGTYYIREVEAPTNYALQMKTFTMYFEGYLADPETNTLYMTTTGVGDPRQTVRLSLKKVDELTGEPVVGAVYALYTEKEENLTEDDLPMYTSTYGELVEPNTLVGYYMTDSDGMIWVESFGSQAIASHNLPAVTPNSEGGFATEGSGIGSNLVNGKYYFKEVVAPKNYVLSDEEIHIDATYQANDTADDRIIDGVGTVSPAGRVFTVATKVAKETRQSVVINFQKYDSISNGETANYHYGLNANGYADAVSYGAAATLENAEYQLIVEETAVVDIETGDLIYPNDVIGVYYTDADGHFVMDEINVGKYAGHPIPNGKYRLIEITPPQGYALNTDPIHIDASWLETDSDENTVAMRFRGPDTILSQAIDIVKTNDAGEPLADVKFVLYSVADLINACGYDVMDDLWIPESELYGGFHAIDRDELLNIITANSIAPAKDANGQSEFFTDADGVIHTGEFIYGDYIVFEAAPPTNYELSETRYIQIPWVKIEFGGSAPSAGAEEETQAVSFAHNVIAQPEENYSHAVINTPIPDNEKTTVTVVKQWEDNNNEYGLRPNKIFVQLYAAGEAYGAPVELKAENNWAYTWSDLPLNGDDGAPIVYTVDEPNVPDNYEKTVDGYKIINECTYVPDINNTVNFTVQKTWTDNDNEYGLRPEHVMVRLYANGGEYGPAVELNDENSWTYTWYELPDGVVYTVDEPDDIEHYEKFISPVANGAIITNTCTYTPPVELVEFTVVKEWRDNNNFYNKRPGVIDVKLMANGVDKGGVIQLRENTNWSYTWIGLPKYDENGGLIYYSARELSVPAFYEYKEAIPGENSVTLVNECTYEPTPLTTEITVEKKWEDNDNQYGLRPNYIVVQLKADGEDYDVPVTISAESGWTHTWLNLPLEAEGDAITYTVVELNVPTHYEASVNGYVITNTCTYVPEPEKTTFTVLKTWEDNNNMYGLRPASILVQLYADEVAYGEPVELNAENYWSYTWDSLPKEDGGREIVYSVDETSTPTYYEKFVSGGDIINTCTYVPETTDITVEKKWEDNNNEYGVRPVSVTVQLYADGDPYGTPIILNETNNWSTTWSDCPKYHGVGGSEVIYTVDEISSDANYEKSVNGFVITNTCTFEPIKNSLIVTKFEIIGAERVAVPGAVLQILDENRTVVILPDGTPCEWTTPHTSDYVDEFGVVGHLIDDIPAGHYILHEVSAPSGYATSPDIPFEVVDSPERQELAMEEKPLKVVVNKVDKANGSPLTGAELVIYDSDNNIVYDKNNNPLKWNTDGSAKEIKYLSVGKYTVKELNAPDGYAIAQSVEFDVIDTPDSQSVTVENERTLGVITVSKQDAETLRPLKNAHFAVISVNEVRDPVTNSLIFAAGEEVSTFKTGADGIGESDALPIATYGASGLHEKIVYKLIETKAPLFAQYKPDAYVDGITFAVDTDTALVNKTYNLVNAAPTIEAHKSAEPKTFVGFEGDEINDVTVVKENGEIEYTISVRNTGMGTAYNIVVKDTVPEYTEYLKSPDTHHREYDAASKTLYWTIDEIAPGDTVNLKFTVKVNTDSCVEIKNIAYYAMPETIPEPGNELDPKDEDIEWKATEVVVHQTVAFIKESVVPGGFDENTANYVACGDTIVYKMTYISKYPTKGVIVSDIVPKGLDIVTNSVKVDGALCSDYKFDPVTRELLYPELNLDGGVHEFTFAVTVAETKLGEGKYFKNIAKVTYEPGDGSESQSIVSDPVTHKTEKKLTVEKYGAPSKELIAAGVVGIPVLDASYNNFSALLESDEVVYQILVSNNGLNDLKEIVVEDIIPDGMSYVSHADIDGVKSRYDEDAEKMVWYIETLPAMTAARLTFVASVDNQEAMTITNSAFYGENDPDDGEEFSLGENKTETNKVKNHVIELHKTSEVKGGTSNDDATVVSMWDEIVYMLEVVTTQDIHNAIITDEIPEGLSFVDGSLEYKPVDGEWESVNDSAVEVVDGVEIVKFISEKIGAGKSYLRFTVKVESVKVNTEKFFINQANINYSTYEGSDRTDTLYSELVSHMTTAKLEGNKSAEIETFEGDYDARHHVTVVEDGDDLTFFISVSNLGESDLKGLTILDPVPAFTAFVSADKDGKVVDAVVGEEKIGEIVYWYIPELKAGETETVTLTVKCDTDGTAQEIINTAAYTYGVEDIKDLEKNLDSYEWYETEEVVYQTTSLTKSASIKFGKDGLDAPYTKIGTKFTYYIDFESADDVYDLSVKDVLPKGLKLIEDSGFYILSNNKEVEISKLTMDKNRLIQFPTLDHVEAGVTTFGFEVQIEDVEEYDRDYFFINTAAAQLKNNEDSETVINLESNPVSHKTIKTNGTDTPVLGFDGMSKTTKWSAIAVVSAIAMIGFGIIGFAGNKKNNK